MTLQSPALRRAKPLRVALIGAGPRGLAALEALAAACARSGTDLRVCVYDPCPAPGAGPNFDPGQSKLDRLNIPLRVIDLPAPDLPGLTMPGFADWLALRGDAPDPEAYLPRAYLGRYLCGRWKAVTTAMRSRWGPMAIRLLATRVLSVQRTDAGWAVQSEIAEPAVFDAVLMSPGQPMTNPDAQLHRWQMAGGGRVRSAYPTASLSRAAFGWRGRTVAVRGLGLAAVDVLRALTLGMGGRFESEAYVPSGSEPARIVPFSLDGQPPMPKPATASLDARFDPGSHGTERLSQAFAGSVAAACSLEPEAALTRICRDLTPMVADAMLRAAADPVADPPAHWLSLEMAGKAPPEDPNPVVALERGMAMADAQRPPSAGYAAGQVWRWLQPALRQGFRQGRPSPATAAAVIGFDEGMKRYSYGLPLVAARELRSLIAAGLVDLRAADDPDISVGPDGWRLRSGDDTIHAVAMIDAVLPGPDLSQISEPLICHLQAQGNLAPVAPGLGAELGPAGMVAPGLALLGRMGLGSVIATDSIHDCFGDEPRCWAQSLVPLVVSE